MQPGDAADYEAEARTYFESLRQPFEQTLRATQKDHPRLVLQIGAVVFIIGVLAIPFGWTIATFVFHQNAYTLFGKPRAVTEIAGVLFLCCFATLALTMMVQMVIQIVEFHSATKPLSQRVMVFALSYAIVRELDSFELSNLPHHRHTAIELFAKLLTYLRWALQGMNPDSMHFQNLPLKDYPVAPYAQKFAEVLNWNENRKPEYSVIVALNSLHSKVSPRLQNGQDVSLLKSIFNGIGNFFYTIVVQRRNGQTSWGYAQLLQSAEIINGMSTIAEPEGSQRAPFFSTNVFTHTNIAVAFLAWWLVFQASFIVLISMSFRFFPTLTMNSQAMVGLIAAPVAAAISMVGISRKNS